MLLLKCSTELMMEIMEQCMWSIVYTSGIAEALDPEI